MVCVNPVICAQPIPACNHDLCGFPKTVTIFFKFCTDYTMRNIYIYAIFLLDVFCTNTTALRPAPSSRCMRDPRMHTYVVVSLLQFQCSSLKFAVTRFDCNGLHRALLNSLFVSFLENKATANAKNALRIIRVRLLGSFCNEPISLPSTQGETHYVLLKPYLHTHMISAISHR